MFYRKARLIQILNADLAQAREQQIVLRSTNATLRDGLQSKTEALARSAAEIATLTDELRLTKEALAGSAQHQAELNASAGEALARRGEELEKLQDKLREAQEETRLAREEAAAAARRDSFGMPRFEEPSPGVGDYSSGRTHEKDGEWR